MFLADIDTKKVIKKPEISIYKDTMRQYESKPEKMYVEDLAALEKITEEKLLTELSNRIVLGNSYTFVGDVLLSINSNELPTEYDRSVNYFQMF